jgi:hypothetical protein
LNSLITTGVMAALSALCAATAHEAEHPDRPNIVWISLEDITPMMGCYGDEYARTSVFDGLAAEGIRYTKAHSNAPVLKKWVELARQGKLTGPQAMLNLRFKPIEELYDSENDPDMIHNVVDENTAIPEMLDRATDPDAAVRFWAVLGLVALQSDDAEVIAALQVATRDKSVSVRITAADGLFNLGRYEDGLLAVIAALEYPIQAAQIRASSILDTQPPNANPKLQPAIETLEQASQRTDVQDLPGIPFGLNAPFKQALKAITGEETYDRW